MNDWIEVDGLAQKFGDSFFVFDEAQFVENYARLSSSFQSFYGNVGISYSYKTNYTPQVCKIVSELGGYAEVVSEMEYWLAKSLGVSDSKIIYNGPYKSFKSLRAALVGGAIVNLDSMRDFKNVMTVSDELPDQVISISIRCNFDLGDGSISRFGFDVDGEEFAELISSVADAKNIRLAGIHCHFPNRDLASYAVRAEKMIELSRKLFPAGPDFINLGGGYFSKMPAALAGTYKVPPPEFEDYARVIGELFANEFTGPKKPVLLLEPGTALVANTFKFYTRVISKKNIRGKNIATVSGSIFNISPTARSQNLPVTVIRQCKVAQDVGLRFDIAGFTCIESDYLTKGISGPIDVDDFLVYENVGSYSIVMKPPFILPNVPIIKIDGRDVQIIKDAESFEYIFQNFKR